jgi:hypothetical protein
MSDNNFFKNKTTINNTIVSTDILSITAPCYISNNLYLLDNLSVTNSTTLLGNVDITGSTTIGGVTTINNALNVVGSLTLIHPLILTDSVTFNENVLFTEKITAQSTVSIATGYIDNAFITSESVGTLSTTLLYADSVTLAHVTTDNINITTNLSIGGILTANDIIVSATGIAGNKVSLKEMIIGSNGVIDFNVTAYGLDNQISVINAGLSFDDTDVNVQGNLSVTNDISISGITYAMGGLSTGVATTIAESTGNYQLQVDGNGFNVIMQPLTDNISVITANLTNNLSFNMVREITFNTDDVDTNHWQMSIESTGAFKINRYNGSTWDTKFTLN